MIRQLTIYTLLLALPFMNACTDEDAPRNVVQIPVSLYIPADVMETRTLPGDPGSYEQFNQPNYLYLYLVFNKQSKTQIYSIERNLDQGWEKMEYNGDSIYRYRGSLNIYMVQDEACLSARVYAAVSSTSLNLTVDRTSEEAILNATFTLTDANIQSLQDIYSTPYNLMEKVNNVDQYYGTIKEINTAVPHVDLILYHVAAKVDLIWNVADDKQSDIRLIDKITVKGLSRTGYLFRPNENAATLVGSNTYSHTISINPGNQWDGRAYFYAIPYSNGTNYPLILDMKAQGKADKSVLLNIPYQNSTTDPFTHWMRGNITINGWNESDN
ncbi:MAG: hypothetical protein IKU98_01585 [Bacteroidaceae bacterium]|nr:hypothetical protein [Bacteroidaceae bacterium]